MIDFAFASPLSLFLDVPGFFSNCSIDGKVWHYWRQGIFVNKISKDEQYCNVKVTQGDLKWIAYFVYAECSKLNEEGFGLPWIGLGLTISGHGLYMETSM